MDGLIEPRRLTALPFGMLAADIVQGVEYGPAPELFALRGWGLFQGQGGGCGEPVRVHLGPLRGGLNDERARLISEINKKTALLIGAGVAAYFFLGK